MITFDKQLTIQKILCTLSENEFINVTDSVAFLVENKASNVNYKIILSNNLSSWKKRIDEYEINTSVIENWDLGFYSYEFHNYNTDDNSIGELLEIGLLQVLDKSQAKVFVNTQESEEDDDYIILN